MNLWHNEYLGELHRQDILSEAKHIQTERLTHISRIYRPGLFERTMFNFANWMISTGKQLRKRYEIPAVNCNSTPTRSLAR